MVGGSGEDDRGSQGNHHSISLFTILSILCPLSYFLFLLLSLLLLFPCLPHFLPPSSPPSFPFSHATYSGSTLGQALSEVLACHLSLTYSYKTGIAPSFSQMRELRCGRLSDLPMAPDLTSKTVCSLRQSHLISPLIHQRCTMHASGVF